MMIDVVFSLRLRISFSLVSAMEFAGFLIGLFCNRRCIIAQHEKCFRWASARCLCVFVKAHLAVLWRFYAEPKTVNLKKAQKFRALFYPEMCICMLVRTYRYIYESMVLRCCSFHHYKPRRKSARYTPAKPSQTFQHFMCEMGEISLLYAAYRIVFNAPPIFGKDDQQQHKKRTTPNDSLSFFLHCAIDVYVPGCVPRCMYAVCAFVFGSLSSSVSERIAHVSHWSNVHINTAYELYTRVFKWAFLSNCYAQTHPQRNVFIAHEMLLQ